MNVVVAHGTVMCGSGRLSILAKHSLGAGKMITDDENKNDCNYFKKNGFSHIVWKWYQNFL